MKTVQIHFDCISTEYHYIPIKNPRWKSEPARTHDEKRYAIGRRQEKRYESTPEHESQRGSCWLCWRRRHNKTRRQNYLPRRFFPVRRQIP